MPSMPDVINLEKPLAIIGDEDVIIGFKALGFKVYPVNKADECKAALGEVMRDSSAICLIQDNFYVSVQDEITRYRNRPLAVFIPFSKKGRTDLLDTMVKDIRLKATGAA